VFGRTNTNTLLKECSVFKPTAPNCAPSYAAIHRIFARHDINGDFGKSPDAIARRFAKELRNKFTEKQLNALVKNERDDAEVQHAKAALLRLAFRPDKIAEK
jgi:hypothetical protein